MLGRGPQPRLSSVFHQLADGYKSALEETAVDTRVRRAARERPYSKTPNGGSKTTDVVVFEGRDAVFVEVVAKRTRFHDTISALDPVSVRSDLDKMLVEKGEEVRDRLADFAAGR